MYHIISPRLHLVFHRFTQTLITHELQIAINRNPLSLLIINQMLV